MRSSHAVRRSLTVNGERNRKRLTTWLTSSRVVGHGRHADRLGRVSLAHVARHAGGGGAHAHATRSSRRGSGSATTRSCGGTSVTPSRPRRSRGSGQAKEAAYRDMVRERGIEPLPGVRAMARAAARRRLASRPWRRRRRPPTSRVIIEVLGLEDCFEAWVSGEEVAHGKPAPDVFLRAAAEARRRRRRARIVVEDAPAGVEAGRRGGMRTIGITSMARALDADIVVAVARGSARGCVRSARGEPRGDRRAGGAVRPRRRGPRCSTRPPGRRVAALRVDRGAGGIPRPASQSPSSEAAIPTRTLYAGISARLADRAVRAVDCAGVVGLLGFRRALSGSIRSACSLFRRCRPARIPGVAGGLRRQRPVPGRVDSAAAADRRAAGAAPRGARARVDRAADADRVRVPDPGEPGVRGARGHAARSARDGAVARAPGMGVDHRARFRWALLVKGVFGFVVPITCGLWLAAAGWSDRGTAGRRSLGGGASSRPVAPWIGLALVLLAAPILTIAYEWAYRRVSGDSFLAFYTGPRLRPDAVAGGAIDRAGTTSSGTRRAWPGTRSRGASSRSVRWARGRLVGAAPRTHPEGIGVRCAASFSRAPRRSS